MEAPPKPNRRKFDNDASPKVPPDPKNAVTRKRKSAVAAKTSYDRKAGAVPFSWRLSCHRNASRRDNSIENDDPTVMPPPQKKVNCPFILQARLVSGADGDVEVELEELHGHYFHTPGDREDMSFLPLSEKVTKRIVELLGYGMKPLRVMLFINNEEDSGKYLGEGSLVASLRGRRTVQLRDIENIRRKMQHTQRLDASDVKAVDRLVKQLQSIPDAEVDDYVLYYDRDAENRTIELAISTPFQRRMLKAFGTKMIFMNAVYGLNQYGYAMLTLLVRDDHGNGVPVAFCISDAEDSQRWQRLISSVFEAAGVDSTGVHIMIDKSVTERAALKDLNISYLLCIFHMLQEVERFLKSGDSGVHGKGKKNERLAVLHRMRELQRLTDKAAFEVQWADSINNIRSQGLNALANYLESSWEHDAPYRRARARRARRR